MHDFRLGNAVVRPRLNEIHVEGRVERLPAKFIDVLMLLAERQGAVVDKRELLKRVWNDPLVGEDSLANAIWMLRRVLGDDARRPAFIATVPRRGYCLIAKIGADLTPADNDPVLVPPETAETMPAATSIESECPPEVPREPVPALPLSMQKRAHFAMSRQSWLAMALVLVSLVGLQRWLFPATATQPPHATPFAFRTGGDVIDTNAYLPGVTFLADASGTLYSVDSAQGTENWRFRTGGGPMSMAPPQDSRIAVGSDDGFVYLLDVATGHELWRHGAGHPVHTAPLLRDDRVIYGDNHGDVRAIDTRDAQVDWHVLLPHRPTGPILGLLDLAIVQDLDGDIVALDRGNGSQRWQRHFDGLQSDLVALTASRLVFASQAGYVTALDVRDGTTVWQVELPAAELPPLVQGDTVFALGRYGDLTALCASDGSTQWRTRVEVADEYDLVWWRDRLVVMLEAGVLGLVNPHDGRVERRLRLPERPDGLDADDSRLVVATQTGRVFGIERDSLDQVKGTRIAMDSDARLEALPEQDNSGTRYALESVRPGTPLPTLLWRAPVVGDTQDVAIGSDGAVFLGDEHAAIAFSANGTTLWRTPLSSSSSTRFLPTARGVYFGRRDHGVYALDPATGKELWHYTTEGPVIAPPTLANGLVYVGSDDHRVYALRQDTGEVAWSFLTQRQVRGAAAYSDGLIIVGSADQNVYALDALSGVLRWKFAGDDWMVSEPLVLGQRVFIGSGNGDFRALNLGDGKELWRVHSGGDIFFRAAADERFVYFGSGDGHLYALDQNTGAERWRFRTGAAAEGSVILADGVLYAGSHDAHLYAIDVRSGRALWRLRAGGSVFNPSVADDRLYVASADQYLYALKLPHVDSERVADTRAPERARHPSGPLGD
jgi:outer membrane protein assembly factor BamB/DNA-binding winged helix-turn-helix (wHTH) protein